jgi:hypothetical protein
MLRSSRALRGFLGVIASVSASPLAFASPSIFTNANEMGAVAVVSSVACKAVRGYVAKRSVDEHVEVFSFLFRHPFGFFGNYSRDMLEHHTILNLDLLLLLLFFGIHFFPVGILGTFAQIWSCRKVCLSPVHNNSTEKCFGAC